MIQESTEFRGLLEQVLPLGQIPVGERSRMDRALLRELRRELDAAASMAIERLEARAAPRPATEVASVEVEVIDPLSLHFLEPRERDGVLLYPRSALPTRASADITQIRRLLNWEDLGLLSDPRSSQAREVLHEQLAQAGREMVGTADIRLLAPPTEVSGARETPFDPGLSSRALAQPELLFYCPDLTHSRPLAAIAGDGPVRALVVLAITSGDRALALLEVRSHEAAPFHAEDLARIALLADFCGTVLDRAERLEKLVFVDSMTGVYNRSYFELQARNEIARAMRERSSVGLCIADIDDFKAMNTAYGYEAGNEVLTQVANALKSGVRPFDTVARWGGEEFAVLLTPPALRDDVAAICERLRHTVERMRFSVEGLDQHRYDVRVSLSMGVAVFPEHGDDSADLWRAANQALLEAKRPPKNKVVFFQR